MATKNKPAKKQTSAVGGWSPSWRRLLIMGSLSLNIAFVVVFITLAFTHVLDGMFMPVGLQRYCSVSNDDKFETSAPKVRALREYVCDRDAAHPYFTEGFEKYLDSRSIAQ